MRFKSKKGRIREKTRKASIEKHTTEVGRGNMEVRRWTVQLIGSIVGISSFFILPGVFKFFSFFISIFAFAISVRSVDNYFSMSVLVICLCIFAMFSSSLLTFDSQNSINYRAYISYAETGAGAVLVISGVGVPILLILGGIWGIIRGNAVGGTTAFFKAFLIAGVGLVICFIFEVFHIPTGGFSKFVLDFWNELISFIFEAPIQLYEGVDQVLENLGLPIDLPNIPKNKHFRQPKKTTKVGGGGGGGSSDTGNPVVDVIVNTFSGSSFDTSEMDHSTTVYAIPDALPLIAGLINLVSIPFFKNPKTEKAIVSWLSSFGKEPRKTIKKREDKRLPYANFFMICYGVVLMFAAFFIFLSYSHAYGSDTKQDWRTIMFIYYMLMTFVSIWLLQKYHHYTPATFVNTIKGTFFGIVGLYAMTRLFMDQVVMSVFSTVGMHSNSQYVVNTFVFVAPAETFAFCLLIPCLIMTAISIHWGKEPRSEEQINLRSRITRLDDMIIVENKNIEQQDSIIDAWKFMGTNSKMSEEKRKVVETKVALETDNIDTMRKDLAKNKKLRQRLIKEEKELRPEIPFNELIENPSYLVIFMVGLIGAAFLFASAHWIMLSPELDYNMFWLGGLGVIYFSGGFWFIIIGLKYGWLSAINVHAIYNTLTIIAVIVLTA
jgi:hypothetical protein